MGRPNKHGQFCSVPGCGGTHKARGFCNRHYLQMKNYGRIAPEPDLQFQRVKLMKRRTTLGMTMQQLADRAGMDVIRYGQFERGNIDISDKQRLKINRALEERRAEVMKQHYDMLVQLDGMKPLTWEDFEFYTSEGEWE